MKTLAFTMGAWPPKLLPEILPGETAGEMGEFTLASGKPNEPEQPVSATAPASDTTEKRENFKCFIGGILPDCMELRQE
jgi:hypothetical protein